ncbi:MAG: glycosyltransferase family A protein, partial [Thaumarchaeota archaeon]|nr:glycosyltransferase family A protein [Nitrososphaerota archaeon]
MKTKKVKQSRRVSNSKILVCIPFHGRRDELLNTVLLKLLDQTYLKRNIHIFLVDNMSEDPVGKVADDFLKSFGSQYWGHDIVKSERNVVYMRNLGVAKANSLKCEFIFFLDSDVFLKPTSISNSVEIMQKDDKIFSVGQQFLLPMKDEGFIFGTKRKYANFSHLDKRE